MDSDRYKEVFVEEGREHILILNQNLLALEKSPEDEEAINEIFRGAHTLKGMAGTLSFNRITGITHAMENILDEVRSHKRNITSEMIDLLLEATDTLEGLIDDVMELGEERERDLGDLLFRLGTNTPKANDKVVATSTELDDYQLNIIDLGINQGLTSYWVDVELESGCLLKAARAYLVFQTLESFGDIIKSVPEVQEIEEERFDLSFKVLLLTEAKASDIKARIETISEISMVTVEEVKRDPLLVDTALDLDKKTLSRDGKKAKAAQVSSSKPQNNHHMRSVRVDIERLDSLMNLVSELIIIKNTMEGIEGYKDEPAIAETMEYLSRVTNELHDAVMKVRMVPIETVFNRFPRVVRDLARNTQKEVRLNLKGAETEVDRTIVDEIGDPLIHLIRNAIDHGIEHPDERVKAGKEPYGLVELAAYHDGNNVVIEIVDDGHGIDIENIGRIAVERDLVSPEELESMSDEKITDLMFLPGFSTAKSVSDISGRGVGMDVVKTKVESMGGAIDVDTRKGQGSRFIIRLPLTLSIIQVLLVELGGGIFAIPLSSVLEIVEIPRAMISMLGGQEVIPYGENLIPLIRMEEELDIATKDSENETLTLVVVKKGEKLSALSIGTLLGQQEIVIKPLGKYLSDIKVIAGGTILGDGSLALILDINHLV